MAYWVDMASCTNRAISFEVHYYDVFGGCMVLHESKFIPLDAFRVIDDSKENKQNG